MTPHTPGKIKAFYAEDAKAATAAAADQASPPAAAQGAGDAQRSSIGGRSSVAGSAAAFEVLQFQQPAAEQPVSADSLYCSCIVVRYADHQKLRYRLLYDVHYTGCC